MSLSKQEGQKPIQKAREQSQLWKAPKYIETEDGSSDRQVERQFWINI